MKTALPIEANAAVARLTALWAFSEAGLAGVMHALRAPFTGLVAASLAVVWITLIAAAAPRRRDLLRALLVVLMVKAAASPHSPPTAYLAVAFQGLCGYLLFGALPGLRLPALLLGVVALLESAAQKLLVMTLLFGAPLWKAADEFVRFAAAQLGASPALAGRWWIIGLYGGIYLMGGLLAGWYAGSLPARWRAMAAELPPPGAALPQEDAPAIPRRRRLLRPLLLFVALLLAASAWLETGKTTAALLTVLRVAAILLLWYALLAPLLMRGIRLLLQRRQAAYAREVDSVLGQLPQLRRLARSAWRDSAGAGGLRRFEAFILRMLSYEAAPPQAPGGA